MKKILGVLSALFFLISVSYASDPASILQVNVYMYDTLHDMYTLSQQGSAVVIDATTAVTNAHVVSDEEGDTSYYYEVCKTASVSVKADCWGSAYVKKMIVDKDLAVLKFDAQEDIIPVKFANQPLGLGDSVKVLGYPANGGETITQTEGKISGFDGDYYKTDASLDSGNSGGGAFNEVGELIGIPTFVSVGYTTLGYIVPLSHVNEVLYDSPVLDGGVSSGFETYLNTIKNLGINDAIVTDAYTIKKFGNHGFEIDMFKQGVSPTSPSFLHMSTPTGETAIIISTYTMEDEEKLRKAGDSIYENQSENFKITKNKIVTLGEHTWEVTFAAGVEGLPEFKSLTFTLQESELNLRYTVFSTERNEQPFVDALVMFLKEFTIDATASVETPVGVVQAFDSIGIDLASIPGSYGFDESGEYQYQFVLDDTPSLPNTMELFQYDDASEFETLSYQEFMQYVRGSIDEYDLESVDGISIDDSFFMRNEQGVLMVVQPMEYTTEDQSLAMYSVIILLENEGVVTQYVINMYAENTQDTNAIVSFLSGIQTGEESTHPFSEIGVDDEEIVLLEYSILGK